MKSPTKVVTDFEQTVARRLDYLKTIIQKPTTVCACLINDNGTRCSFAGKLLAYVSDYGNRSVVRIQDADDWRLEATFDSVAKAVRVFNKFIDPDNVLDAELERTLVKLGFVRN